MKRRMMVLVMITVLAASSPAMVACQTEEAASFSSSMGGLETFTTVAAWGNNFFGQLGNGTTTDSSKPVQVSELDGIEAIAAGGAHGLPLKDGGTVWAWGMNQDGQLGNGAYTLGTSAWHQHAGAGGQPQRCEGHSWRWRSQLGRLVVSTTLLPGDQSQQI